METKRIKYSNDRSATYQYPEKYKKDAYEIYDSLCRSDHFDNFTSSELSLNEDDRTISIEGEINEYNSRDGNCYFCSFNAGEDGLCSVCRKSGCKVTEKLREDRQKQIKLGLKKHRKLKYKKIFPEQLEIEYSIDQEDKTVILTLVESSEN